MGPTGDSSSGEDATGGAARRPAPEGGGPSPASPGAPSGPDRAARLRRFLPIADRVLACALTGFVGLSLAAVLFYAQRPVPATLLMAQRALEGQEVRYAWRPIEAISPNLVRAVIAAEDARFCSHSGFDFDAIQDAMREAERRGRLRGASTISQQTAKNAFLWPQRSWVRKGAETWFTMLVEALWPKRRIMEVYLNVAEWGDGVFGAEAAARARFGKSASELTAREAALLAAVLPNPNEWRVDPPGSYVSGRAGSLQRRMGDVRAGGLDSCVLDGS